MNKILLSALLFTSIILTSKAQIYTPNGIIQGVSGNNNVGIGTTTPSNKLHIIGDALKIAINENANNAGYYALLQSFHSSETGILSFVGAGGGGKVIGGSNYGLDTVLFSNNTEKIRILNSGYVGIGTINPLTKLHVDGDISTSVNGSIGFNTSDSFLAYGGNRPHYGLGYSVSGNPLTLSGYYGLSLFTFGNERLRVDAVGNVGIGTTTPDSKLTVNGNIHAKEVRIDTSFPVPDYVFANDYKLKTLPEVEAYIKQNSHLPEIPSAQEIEKNGLMLAEMNMALLKKMEEMTLYMIEQNKKLEIQQNENTIQSKEIIKLKEANDSYKAIAERMSKLENQLKN